MLNEEEIVMTFAPRMFSCVRQPLKRQIFMKAQKNLTSEECPTRLAADAKRS
jgi:hypothetical protein